MDSVRHPSINISRKHSNTWHTRGPYKLPFVSQPLGHPVDKGKASSACLLKRFRPISVMGSAFRSVFKRYFIFLWNASFVITDIEIYRIEVHLQTHKECHLAPLVLYCPFSFGVRTRNNFTLNDTRLEAFCIQSMHNEQRMKNHYRLRTRSFTLELPKRIISFMCHSRFLVGIVLRLLSLSCRPYHCP